MNVTTTRSKIRCGEVGDPGIWTRNMGQIIASPGYSTFCNDFLRQATYLQNLYAMITICSSRSNSDAALSWIEDFEARRVMNAKDTSAETKPDLPLEIGHLLLIDVVGYSKLLVDEQIEFLEQLNQIVRSTQCFRAAETAGKLIRLPTGDGMALLFLHSPEEPLRCALEISRTLKDYPHIQVRMGVHSGPVNQVTDVNDRTNIAGAGINIAQRVMDCGDAGHILLSRHVAEDLEHYLRWQPHLRDLGEVEVKHGGRVHVFNFCIEDLGNPEVPEKLRLAKATCSASEGDLSFGVYEIDCHADGSLCELGRGAMGVTYRATDTSLQRKVALKIIKTDIADRSADARERFVREARAAAAFRHENTAAVYQFGMRLETGQYFYAMELIEGETLDERVRRAGPLSVRTTIDIGQQVTAALAAAETRGLVHRDLKPANLMLVSPDGESTNTDRKDERFLVKIIDFGLAKALNAPLGPMSLTGDKFVGTPAFASPEQFEHSALDVRSDIYSLGETLWFALTGKTPFAGRGVQEIHRAQQSHAPPMEQLKAAHVPSRVRSLLESMLAFEPAARPGTRELAAELQRCAAQPSGVRRTVIALAAVAVILILGVSAFFVFRSLRTQNLVSSPVVPEKSIAVLPFENLSAEKENAYFADGMQDEILSLLAKIADLTTISRVSVMQYKSRLARNLREIGQQLGVANVVEGSVQRSGNRVRVNAQLVDARTGRQLWAQTYDRDLADAFAIQSEIAKAIAEQLQTKLSPGEENAIESPPTSDITTSDLYTRAKNLPNAGKFVFPKRSRRAPTRK